jgi:hypothetical protein
MLAQGLFDMIGKYGKKVNDSPSCFPVMQTQGWPSLFVFEGFYQKSLSSKTIRYCRLVDGQDNPFLTILFKNKVDSSHGKTPVIVLSQAVRAEEEKLFLD